MSALNVASVLEYIAQSTFRLGRNYLYSGDLSANTQAQFNALVWMDTNPKPSWAQVVGSNDLSIAWHAARSAGGTSGFMSPNGTSFTLGVTDAGNLVTTDPSSATREHRTGNDVATGNLEGSPRVRVNRTAALVLSTTWQRVDFNGVSSSNSNVNTFPIIAATGLPRVYWDATNKLIKFQDTVDRNYSISFFAHLVASGLIARSVQMRFVVPDGVSAGVPLYFPFPEESATGGAYKDIAMLAATSDVRISEPSIIYASAGIRAGGLGLELRVSDVLLLGATVSMTSANFVMYGR